MKHPEIITEKVLNIFFVVDRNYIIPFTVTLTSILHNNKNLEIKVYVIHEFEEINLLHKASRFFKENYKIKLNIIKINNKCFDKFYTSKHITKTTYFKLLLPELIPQEIEKGLYIDCDIVVTGSLREIKNLNFFDSKSKIELSIYAVKDIREQKEIERFRMMGQNIENYYNAGVMVLNIKKMRNEGVSSKMIKIGEKFQEKLIYHDQDIINIFFKNELGPLENTYNADAAIKHNKLPIILHYLGSSKPWQFLDNGPNKKLYYEYLRMTPFVGIHQEKITLENVARKYYRLLKEKFIKHQS